MKKLTNMFYLNKSKIFKTIKFRLSAIFCGATIAISITGSIIFFCNQKQYLLNLLYINASGLTQTMAANAASSLLNKDKIQLSVLTSTQLKNPGVISAGILDHKGKAVMHSDIKKIGRSILQKELASGRQAVFINDRLVSIKPIYISGKKIGSAVLVLSAVSVFEHINQLKKRLLAVVLLFSVLSCLSAVHIIGFFLKPLKKLSSAAQKIGDGDLNTNVLEKGGYEIQSLGRAFNRMTGKLSDANNRIEEGYLQSVMALTAAVEAKDPYTRGHCDRVAYYAEQIAGQIGMDKASTNKLILAGQLHDLGKIGVNEKILCKPGRLTEEEYNRITRHPMIAWRILEPAKFLSEVRDIIIVHHERFDGKGYPNGLSGNKISLEGRIIALADCYDAMTSNRPYRKHLSEEKALSIIDQERGRQFDPVIVTEFFAAHKRFESRESLDKRLEISSRGRIWVCESQKDRESPEDMLSLVEDKVA